MYKTSVDKTSNIEREKKFHRSFEKAKKYANEEMENENSRGRRKRCDRAKLQDNKDTTDLGDDLKEGEDFNIKNLNTMD